MFFSTVSELSYSDKIHGIFGLDQKKQERTVYREYHLVVKLLTKTFIHLNRDNFQERNFCFNLESCSPKTCLTLASHSRHSLQVLSKCWVYSKYRVYIIQCNSQKKFNERRLSKMVESNQVVQEALNIQDFLCNLPFLQGPAFWYFNT